MGQGWRHDASEEAGSMVQGRGRGYIAGNPTAIFSRTPQQHAVVSSFKPTVPIYPHSRPCDPGPSVVIICIFVFPPLPGWEHFSLSASQGQGAGSQLAQKCPEGHGVQEEGHGVNTACGPIQDPNKTSRPAAHSLPLVYLPLITLRKEMS